MGDPACWMHLLDEDGNIIAPPDFQLDIRSDDHAEAAPVALDLPDED